MPWGYRAMFVLLHTYREPLDTKSGERMIPVVAAMSRVENGTPARMDEVRAGWDLFTKYPV